MDKLTTLVGLFEPECVTCDCGSSDTHVTLEPVGDKEDVPVWHCNDCKRAWMSTMHSAVHDERL